VTAVLRARGLAKRYGTVDAVRDLDLEVRRGEIYGFLGPNGAGKTTTLLMLLGIERPTAGRIELFGRPGPIDPFRDRPRIGVVGEQQYLYDDLSAWEYLRFFGRLYGVARADRRAQELLERLELYEFRRLRARDFSRGMQQKLGLARALLHRPELLVLDEPVSGLDPHGIRQVREILTEENGRGATVLLSSHILSEVERTADRVGILFGGRLVAEDDVARLSSRLEPDPVIELDVDQLTPAIVERLGEQPFVRAVELAPNGHGPDQGSDQGSDQGLLRVRVAAGGDYRRDVSAIVSHHGGLITGMRQQQLSLEEAFVRLTSESVQALTRDSAAGVDPKGLLEARLRPPQPPPRHGEGEPGSSCHLSSPARGRDGSGIDGASGRAAGALADPDSPLSGAERGAGRVRSLSARWHAIRVIGGRDVLGMLYGPGVYVVVALGMLATLPIVAGYLDAVQRNGLLILADAFTLPFFVAATIAMLFLALASVTSIARERDQGTLEVLFYGPVDRASYVLAKHLAQVAAYLPVGLGLAALFAAYAGMTGLRLPAAFGLELLLTVFTAAAVAALGVCLSTLVRGARAGIALLGALTGLFLAIRIGSELLSGIQVTNNYSPLLFLRSLVLTLDLLLGYISPFSVFQDGVDALVRSDPGGYLAAILLATAQCVVLVATAVRLLGRRSVRR
jgi:ABC-2 type transport system ATP-binding protein